MKVLGAAARAGALATAVLAVAGGAGAGVAGAASHGNAPAAHGVVTEVNGSTAPGTCGTAGGTGSFVVTDTKNTTPPTTVVTTVNVTAATTFLEHKVTSPSFANLCVGDKAVAVGNAAAGTLAASAVTISLPPKVHLDGKVTSVNGVTTSGTCGTAGATGSFGLSTVTGTTTVDTTVAVDASTAFTLKGVSSPSFANVCVGYRAKAEGSESSGTVTATKVDLKAPKAPKPLHVAGVVTSIGGVSTPGTCGVAGNAGTFTIQSTKPPTVTNWTVNVTAGTAFSAKKVASATFANVCVGGKTESLGVTVNGALDAVAVAAWAPKA
jgi:hypothetical protein